MTQSSGQLIMINVNTMHCKYLKYEKWVQHIFDLSKFYENAYFINYKVQTRCGRLI